MPLSKEFINSLRVSGIRVEVSEPTQESQYVFIKNQDTQESVHLVNPRSVLFVRETRGPEGTFCEEKMAIVVGQRFGSHRNGAVVVSESKVKIDAGDIWR